MDPTPLTIEDKIDLMTPKKVVCKESRKLLLENIRALIYKDWDEVSVKDNSAIIHPHVYRDLEVFTDHNNDDSQSIVGKINRTCTMFGEVSIQEMLKNPISDRVTLTMRQRVIQTILQSDRREQLYHYLDELKGTEHGILWFWEEVTEDVQSLYDMVYFNFETVKPVSDFLNNNEEVLLIITYYAILLSPLLSLLGPIITVISPIILLKLSNPSMPVGNITVQILRTVLKLDVISSLPSKLKMTAIAGMLVWFLFYVYSVYNNYKNALHIHTIVNIVHKKICHVARFVDVVRKLYSLCINLELPIGDFALEEALNRLKNMFSNTVLTQEPKLFNNKGCILTIYRRFILSKDILLPLLGFVAQVDGYASMAKLYSEFNLNKKGRQRYCFVEYGHGDTIQFNAKKIWHPYLDTDVVTNSVKMDSKKRNMLITGPNAAGKSTFIKSIGLSIILAQTFGIAPADKLTMVPFEIINSYLQIPDCKGRDSLFQAEMHRCKDHLDALEAEQDRRSFVIMDEIFSSTNYKEGLAAAYAICKKLINYPKSVSIITTHYTPLGSLQEESDQIYNYRFNARESDSGELTFNYKIEEGISDQYIALKLLKLDGFDDGIINDALSMCDRVSLNVELLNDSPS